jgi:prolipoprotein diacylglyceryltransferase
MAILAWILIRHFRREHHHGQIFFLLLIGYGSYRLALTWVRLEALASMKMFSLIFIITGLLGLLWSARARQPA